MGHAETYEIEKSSKTTTIITMIRARNRMIGSRVLLEYIRRLFHAMARDPGSEARVLERESPSDFHSKYVIVCLAKD